MRMTSAREDERESLNNVRTMRTNERGLEEPTLAPHDPVAVEPGWEVGRAEDLTNDEMAITKGHDEVRGLRPTPIRDPSAFALNEPTETPLAEASSVIEMTPTSDSDAHDAPCDIEEMDRMVVRRVCDMAFNEVGAERVMRRLASLCDVSETESDTSASRSCLGIRNPLEGKTLEEQKVSVHESWDLNAGPRCASPTETSAYSEIEWESQDKNYNYNNNEEKGRQRAADATAASARATADAEADGSDRAPASHGRDLSHDSRFRKKFSVEHRREVSAYCVG